MARAATFRRDTRAPRRRRWTNFPGPIQRRPLEANTAFSSTTTSTLSVTPTGQVEGDWMVAFVASVGGANTLSSASGWTEVGTQVTQATTTTGSLWKKKAGAGEAGPYQWDGANARRMGIIVVAYFGADPTDVVDGSNVASAGATAQQFDHGTLTPGAARDWHILATCSNSAAPDDDAVTFAQPGGYAEQAEISSEHATSANVHMALADRELLDTAATGTQSVTITGGVNRSLVGLEIVIRVPAPAGGDATVTPATIAATTATPQPLVNVAAGPAVAAITAALPQPAANVGAGPTALPAVAALPQPLVNVTAGPAVAPVVVALPQATPTISGDVTAQPAAIAAVVALPQATPSASSIITPATLAAVCALPGAGASVGASPAVLGALVALARPLVNVAASPGVLAAVAAVPTPTVGVITSVSPATITAVVALPQPLVNVRAGPVVLAVVVALPQAVAGQSTTVAPAAVTVVVALPAARLNVGAGPAVVAVLVALPQATPVIPPPIPPPRWVEGGAAASGVLEGAAVGIGVVEGGASV